MYEVNMSKSIVQVKVSRISEISDVNTTLFDWYNLTFSKNIFHAGPQLTEKATEITTIFGKSGFKVNNGWLDKWDKGYNSKHFTVCVGSGDVVSETVELWKDKPPEILKGYKRKIF